MQFYNNFSVNIARVSGNRLLKEQDSGGSVDGTEGYRYNERNGLTEWVKRSALLFTIMTVTAVSSRKRMQRGEEYRYDRLNRQTYVKMYIMNIEAKVLHGVLRKKGKMCCLDFE